MPNIDQLPPKISFSRLQRGYTTSEKISSTVHFNCSFIPSSNDWIIIVPSGSVTFSHFCALKSVPVENFADSENTENVLPDSAVGGRAKKDESKNAMIDEGGAVDGLDEFEDVDDELFPLMPRFKRQKTDNGIKKLEKHEKIEEIDGLERDMGQKMDGQRIRIDIVFDPDEYKLAPNNFYQLAYVRQPKREIIGQSAVFFVEKSQRQPQFTRHFSEASGLTRVLRTVPGVNVQIQKHEQEQPETLKNKQKQRQKVKGPDKDQDINVIKSQVQKTASMTRISSHFHSHSHSGLAKESTAVMTQKKQHGWRNFFCGSSAAASADYWSERPSSYILPTPREVDEEDSEDDSFFEVASSEHRRLISSTDDGFEDEKEKEKPQKSPSSLAQFLIDLWKQPFSAPSGNYNLYIGDTERRSASMYEIGASYNASNSTTTVTEPYQKMVCQLTHSNNNLLHENERLMRKVQQMDLLMKEQLDQLNNVYYTLFRNGVTTITHPDGEEVHLNQFRGQLLNFTKATENGATRAPSLKNVNGMTDFANVIRDRRMCLERTSDLSSESSVSSGSVDQEELKSAMLKCITKSKYNDDLDDFVNWLNDSGVQSARFENERKSRSLEEYMQDSLRVRQPLQRSARVDRARSESELAEGPSPTNSQQSSQQQLQHQESINQQNRQANSGSTKTKGQRLRTQSVAGSKATGLFGSRRTSSVVRQNNDQRSNAQRKSLANLASLRTSNPRQPRRNLI